MHYTNHKQSIQFSVAKFFVRLQVYKINSDEFVCNMIQMFVFCRQCAAAAAVFVKCHFTEHYYVVVSSQTQVCSAPSYENNRR